MERRELENRNLEKILLSDKKCRYVDDRFYLCRNFFYHLERNLDKYNINMNSEGEVQSIDFRTSENYYEQLSFCAFCGRELPKFYLG